MNVLAIDTSTEAQVLGLGIGDSVVEKHDLVGREHSRIILASVVSLLAEHGIDKKQLDLIVFGQGPGSFTGLRIAVGVVQGLAYGLGIPVVGVSTLACLAQGQYRSSGATNIVVAQSARKEEVFFGSYTIVEGIAQLQGSEGVFDASQVPNQAFEHCVGVGSGWQLKDKLETALGVRATDVIIDALPRAADLLTLGLHAFENGEAVSALDAQPEYLRERVASKPASGS
ncbi:MAG TPA: tRNA (adenosine(37)-N6)-threonylcarbamoyltransferase complex dimerization subunit type 1 TsaB [Pseudomonadales bacterium]|nr:tRNA (adenosine(37)-N6)-threonylcarbamoyltransferase complex dimerization subunit type 1 TsaB [Pseudomonadales bacterium]